MALTMVAGWVDAATYLCLSHLYVANMSGNSVSLGIAAGQRNGEAFFRRLLPIMAFVLGLLLCEVLLTTLKRLKVRRLVAGAMMIEAACLSALLALNLLGAPHSTATPGVLVALAAVAMGAQNATLRGCGVLDAYTTHVTGTLTRLARDLARYAFERRHQQITRICTSGGLFVGYLAGAGLGAVLSARWGLASLFIVMAPIFTIIAIDCARPISRRPTKRGIEPT
jgi:uncharacterized membrane protein YoaK (UPF0700 family)